MFHFGLALFFAVLQSVSWQSDASPLQYSPASEISTSFNYTRNDYYYVVVNGEVVSISPTGIETDLETVNLTGTMELTTWSPGLFHFLKEAKVLDLSNNSIAKLPNDGFEDFNKLESLNLSNNQLENLGDTPFANLGMLKHLDLTNNRIQDLRSGNLFGLGSQTDILVHGNNLKSFDTWLFENPGRPVLTPARKEIGRVQNFPISERFSTVKACIRDGILEKLEIPKFNETFEAHCLEVTFDQFRMKIFLKGLGISKFATGWYRLQDYGVTSLCLSENNIVDLSSEIFSQLPEEIKEIDLSGNKIERMINGSMSNPFLETLILSNNSISEIEDGTFEGSNLNELNLSSNRLKSTKFVSTLPTNLSTFTLSKNEIDDLTPNAFIALENLGHLDLSENNIIEVKNTSLRGITKITTLDLSKNKITKIDPNSFSGFENLWCLNLQMNNLTSLQVGTFEGIDSIHTIDFSFNSLTRVTESYFPITLRTSELHLSFNQIEVLETGAFLLSSVHYLALDHNKINKIERGAFGTKCVTLDLSNNALSQPDGEVFEGVHEMEILNLRNNGIERIEKGFAKYFNQSSNYFKLDLSGNMIRKLENGALFGIRKSPWTKVEVIDTPIELIQGGVFNNV